MATISERKLKNGKSNYSIQIKIKKPNGTSGFVCTTWKNEDNLSGVRAKKQAIAYAEQWEKDYKSGHTHKLSTATFKQVADVWLNTRKHTISDSYYVRAVEGINRLSRFFGNKKFVDIKAFDTQQFFVNMNDSTFTISKAKLKESRADEFNKIILDYGVRKAGSGDTFSRPTLFYARKRSDIEYTTAKAICYKFDLKFDYFFDKTIISKHYRKESIMKYKRILSTIFNYAMSIELVERNYASSSYLKKVIGGEPSKEIDVLSDEEFNKLLNTLNNNNIWDTISIYIMATTGIRTCEMCGLKWADIDLEKKVIRIKDNRLYVTGKGIVVKDLKTKYSKRTIPICNLLREKIQEFRNQYDLVCKGDKSYDKSGYIFCNIDGKPRFPHYLNHLLKKYLIEAEIKQISCHKLRHTWITQMISKGAKINVVSKLAGHANSDITLKIYTHYCQDIDNSTDVMETIFGNKVS